MCVWDRESVCVLRERRRCESVCLRVKTKFLSASHALACSSAAPEQKATVEASDNGTAITISTGGVVNIVVNKSPLLFSAVNTSSGHVLFAERVPLLWNTYGCVCVCVCVCACVRACLSVCALAHVHLHVCVCVFPHGFCPACSPFRWHHQNIDTTVTETQRG